MAFAGILFGAVGGIAAALMALLMGAGWLVALSVYAVAGGALAALLIAAAVLRPAGNATGREYGAAGARTQS